MAKKKAKKKVAKKSARQKIKKKVKKVVKKKAAKKVSKKTARKPVKKTVARAAPPPPVAIAWSEVFASDPATARSFYSSVLGWQAREEDMGPMGKYTMFKYKGVDQAGIRTRQGEQSAMWLSYFNVSNVDQAAAKAVQMGGRVIEAPVDIPPGRFAVVADPEGAVFALFKPAPGGM